jgi:membrane protein
MSVTDALNALDRRQQRTRGVRFVAGLLKKYGDDQGGQLAALIAYYAFVSLFPLLLVLVTVLGFVLQGNPSERQKILEGTLGQFPIISDYLKLHSLNGSPTALAIGVVGSLLAGMGFTGAAQTAFNRIWDVPFKHRPNWIFSRLRGLGMLALLGTMAIVSTVVTSYVSSAGHGAGAVVAGVALALALNLALFAIAFRLLTAADLAWRDVLPETEPEPLDR